MDNMRYQAELTVLARKFPANAYRFFGVGTDCPYLRIGARTNSGNVYTFHMDLSQFPLHQPKVFVTRMLKDRNGNDMACASCNVVTWLVLLRMRSSEDWVALGWTIWTSMPSSS